MSDNRCSICGELDDYERKFVSGLVGQFIKGQEQLQAYMKWEDTDVTIWARQILEKLK